MAAKWQKGLTKRDLRHLAEGSSTDQPTLRSLRENLAHQRAQEIQCFECESIARKIKIRALPPVEARGEEG